jgi:outer membrane autotransporter protein
MAQRWMLRSLFAIGAILTCWSALQPVLGQEYYITSPADTNTDGTLRYGVENNRTSMTLQASPVLTAPLTWWPTSGSLYNGVSPTTISGSEITITSGTLLMIQDIHDSGLTISSAIKGVGTIYVSAGTVTLGGDNRGFDGYISNDNHSTLCISSGKNLGTGFYGSDGGTLRFLGNAVGADAVTIPIYLGTDDIFDTNGYDAELSGPILPTAGLFTKTGAGTLTLSKDGNTFLGNMVIEAGTLRLQAQNALHYGTLCYSNSGGTLSFGDITAATLGGLTGSGTLNLENENHSAVTLTIGGFDKSSAFSGALAGSGSIIKIGSGMFSLNGVNTYSGPTTVAAGTLNVNGSLTSNVTVDNGATISGSGTVGGLTVNGAVAPGNSIGTLTVNGNYIQNAGSTYKVEIDANGQSDRVHVNGDAVVDGAVEVTSLSNKEAYTKGSSYNYTILTANSVSGTYDTLTMQSAFLNGFLTYGSDFVTLRVLRNDVSFLEVAQTQNQRAVASYLDAIEPGATGDLATVFGGLSIESADQARTSFDQLSGEPYADLAAINIAGSNLFTDTAFYRIWNMDDLAPVKGRNLWAYGLGNWQHQYAANNCSGYDAPTSGFMIGYDQQYDNVLLGVASGYGRSDVTFLGSPATDRTDLFNVSTYGKADFDNVYVAGVLGYTHGWDGVTRTIQIDTLAPRRASSNPDGNLLGMLFQTGYNIDAGRWRLTPIAGLRYVHDSNTGSVETGADSVDLSVGSYRYNSLSSHFGGKAAFFVTKRWRTEAYAQWEHEYADTTGDVAMVFTGDATSGFTVQGVSSGRDGARTGLVAIGKLNDRTDLRLNYDSFFRAAYVSQQLTGGLSIGF